MSLTLAPISDLEQVNIYGLDITERKRAEGEIRRLARFPSENPNPVLRIAKDGTVIYANDASALLLDTWGYSKTKCVPKRTRELIAEVIKIGVKLDVTIDCDSKIFALTFAPVSDLEQVNVYGLDITERVRAEDALRESEQEHKSILGSISDGFFTLDNNMVVTSFNSAAEILLGKKQDDVLGKSLFESFPEAKGSVFEENYSLAIREKKHIVFEIYFDVPPYINWYDVRVYPYEDGISVYFQTTTERKEAELEISRLAKFPSENPNPVLRVAKDGTIIYANDASALLLDTWGCAESGIVPGRPKELILEVLDSGVKTDVVVDCQSKILALTFAPVVDLEQVNIYGLDITERVRAEEALAESEESIRLMVSEVKDYAIVMLDPDGVIASWNEGAERIKGYSAGEIIGKHMSVLYNERDVKADRPGRLLKEALKAGRAEDEGWRVRKDGTQFMASVIVTTIYDQQGNHKGFSKVTRDITDRKQAELQRELLLHQLEDKTKELEQIIYVSSHDLRSPLVNVQGFAKELENSLNDVRQMMNDDDTPAALKEKFNAIVDKDIIGSLKYINSSVYKMDSLMSGMLKLSRLGRAAMSIQKINMNDLISSIVQSSEYKIKELNITLQIDDLIPCYGDKIQINQVFSNLIDNAIKYLDPNRSGIIKISSTLQDNRVVYCVQDYGIGIMPEHQDKIFEIFHQLNPKKDSGEGLGLTIVQRILERHRGKMWLESASGQGSKFYVSLSATK